METTKYIVTTDADDTITVVARNPQEAASRAVYTAPRPTWVADAIADGDPEILLTFHVYLTMEDVVPLGSFTFDIVAEGGQ